MENSSTNRQHYQIQIPLAYNNSLFFCFFLSRGGSFNALMIKEAADGTTDMVACLFWMVRHTVILRPFQSEVAFAISSPTFLGD